MYGAMPEGMTFVDEIEWDNESYEFNLTRILRDDDGFWIGHDSGCSCPEPFETFHKKSDYEGPFDKSALRWQLEQRIVGDARRSRAELEREVSGILEAL